jgi:hypothetical protein
LSASETGSASGGAVSVRLAVRAHLGGELGATDAKTETAILLTVPLLPTQ